MNLKKFFNLNVATFIIGVATFIALLSLMSHSHGATLIYKSDAETSHAFLTEITCNNNSNFVYYKSFTVLGSDYETVGLTPGFTYHFYVKSQVNSFFQGETTKRQYEYTYKNGNGIFIDTTGDVGFTGGHLNLYASPWA
ncbi:MAG: hypothetical protein CfClM3_0173 [Methanobrevibacter sp. CfCl-M3]